MKISYIYILISVIFLLSCAQPEKEIEKFENGDIIFQSSTSPLSKAIMQATESEYSHCGIIYIQNGNIEVFEAVQPVKSTPLKEWINRGRGAAYVVKRLKNAEKILTPEVLKKMKNIGITFTGKNYDNRFDWSDNKIYCSELVWKIYFRGAGIKLGELKKLKDFNLSNPQTEKILKKLYVNKIPYNESIISPAAIYNSPLLKEVIIRK